MASIRCMGALAVACAWLALAPARAETLGEYWTAQGRSVVASPVGHGSRALARYRIAAPMQLSGARFAMASWHGGGERLNRHMASGAVFRREGLTAAHRTLPLGTVLLVSYAGRSVRVRVNDRGPAAWTGRSLDLSRGAALALGYLNRGVVRVAWRVVGAS